MAVDPNNPAASDRPATTTTAAVTAPAGCPIRSTAARRGRTPRPRTASPAATSSAQPASTGRPVVTPRSRGTPRATRTCPARCSTAAPASRRTRTSPARFYVYRSTGTNGASFNFPGRPVATHDDTAGAGQLPARQAADDRRQPPRQQVRRPGLRHLDDVRRRRHRLHLRGHSNDYGETFSAPVLVSGDSAPVRQHLRAADPAGQLQREPGLAAVHRPGRHAVRRLQQLQQHRHRQRQPQPGAAGPLHRRRPELLRAGQGRRLLRAARLRHLPGRRRRPVPRLRRGEGHQRTTRCSGPPTTRSAASTRPTATGSSSPSAPTSTATPTSPAAARPTGFAADGINTYIGVKNGGCNNDILYSVSDERGRVVLRRPRSTRGSCRS